MYEIANYSELYKPTNSKGEDLVHAKFVKMPVKPRGKGLKALLKDKHGVEVFGIWSLLLEAATEVEKPDLRGKLLNHKNEPATILEIAESISLEGEVKKVEYALSLLTSMGWVNYVQDTDSIRTYSVPPAETGSTKLKISISKDKRKYKDYVYLTDDELRGLNEKLGVKLTLEYIERLNGYIGQIGPKKAASKYVSHYHTILNWSRKDGCTGEKKSGNTQKQTIPDRSNTDRNNDFGGQKSNYGKVLEDQGMPTMPSTGG